MLERIEDDSRAAPYARKTWVKITPTANHMSHHCEQTHGPENRQLTEAKTRETAGRNSTALEAAIALSYSCNLFAKQLVPDDDCHRFRKPSVGMLEAFGNGPAKLQAPLRGRVGLVKNGTLSPNRVVVLTDLLLDDTGAGVPQKNQVART
jgi:hypothetical protein